jgi:predicted metal-dependent hydrolase
MTQVEDFSKRDEQVQKGIDLFNNREFFEAHEVLETEWRREKQLVRNLYQGLIQLSVACLHIQRNNRSGADRLIKEAIGKITPFADKDTGFDLDQLLLEIQALKTQIEHIPPTTNLPDLEIIFPKVRNS